MSSSTTDAATSARNVSALLHRRVAGHGHAPYLTFYDDDTGERTELSYATCENWVAKTANLLVEEFDVGRGERIASVLGNHWTSVAVALACWKVGACLVPLDADDPTATLQTMLGASGARVGFVREDLLPELDLLCANTTLRDVVAVGRGLGARLAVGLDAVETIEVDTLLGYGEEVLAFADDYDDPDVRHDDDAVLALPPRAGSAPAGVRLTQGNLLAAADAFAAWGARGERLLCAQPVQSVEGLVLGHLTPLSAGGSVVLTGRFDAGAFWRKVADERVGVALLTASELDRLVEHPGEPAPAGGLAVVVPGGAAPQVTRRADDRSDLTVHPGHGLVEATCASAITPRRLDEATRRWLDRADAYPVGSPTVHARVTALDAGGVALPPGSRGPLAVAGPVVSPGYDGRPDLDEHRFVDGWLRTGEEGFVDTGPDGRPYVFVTGRL